jgi:hypothetical protein
MDEMGGTALRPSVAALAVGVPPLVLAAATVAVLVLAAFGVHPLWPRNRLTLPEAAITSNDAAIARLVMAGADPNAQDWMRIDNGERSMTPLEAAIHSREARTLRTMLKLGAALEGDAGRRAVCLARVRAPHLLPILEAHGAPTVDPQACPPPRL